MAKTNESDFLNEVMGFDTNNLSIFDETPSAEVNPRIYKTNPVKLSKSEDGHYHSKIRIVYNPFNIRESVVKSVKYSMKDKDGFFQADSLLSLNNKSCPIFTAWKKLHFAKTEDGEPDTKKDNWSKEMFKKAEAKWVLIQVLEDDNQPETVGQFKAWKLPFSIWEVMDAKMHPTPESKKAPVPYLDYLFGPALELDVAPGPEDKDHPERKQREISYSLCSFDATGTPIMKTDCEPLFDDEQLEFIEKYEKAKAALAEAKSKLEKAKTDKQKKDSKAVIEKCEKFIAENQNELKPLYKIALDYMRENAFDIVDECGYHEWDAALTARVNNWLTVVAAMKDPQFFSVDELDEDSPAPKKAKKTTTKKEEPKSEFENFLDEDEPETEENEFPEVDEPETEDEFEDDMDEDDLPF